MYKLVPLGIVHVTEPILYPRYLEPNSLQVRPSVQTYSTPSDFCSRIKLIAIYDHFILGINSQLGWL